VDNFFPTPQEDSTNRTQQQQQQQEQKQQQEQEQYLPQEQQQHKLIGDGFYSGGCTSNSNLKRELKSCQEVVGEYIEMEDDGLDISTTGGQPLMFVLTFCLDWLRLKIVDLMLIMLNLACILLMVLIKKIPPDFQILMHTFT
jgi:hypothetical protein